MCFLKPKKTRQVVGFKSVAKIMIYHHRRVHKSFAPSRTNIFFSSLFCSSAFFFFHRLCFIAAGFGVLCENHRKINTINKLEITHNISNCTCFALLVSLTPTFSKNNKLCAWLFLLSLESKESELWMYCFLFCSLHFVGDNLKCNVFAVSKSTEILTQVKIKRKNTCICK